MANQTERNMEDEKEAGILQWNKGSRSLEGGT